VKGNGRGPHLDISQTIIMRVSQGRLSPVTKFDPGITKNQYLLLIRRRRLGSQLKGGWAELKDPRKTQLGCVSVKSIWKNCIARMAGGRRYFSVVHLVVYLYTILQFYCQY
jgi:hypothetical protein